MLTEEWLIENGFESDGVEREGKVVYWHHYRSGLTYYADTTKEWEQFSVGRTSLNLWLETEKFSLSSEEAVADVVRVLALLSEVC